MAQWTSARQTEKETEVLGDIQKMLLVRYSQPDPSRRQDIIHPSELASDDFCSRKVVYRILGTEPSDPYKPPGFQLQNIFENGHEIHAKWQRWLKDIDRIWGNWICPDCDYLYRDSYFPYTHTGDKLCPGGCGQLTCYYEYAEVLVDGEDDFLTVGKADGAVWKNGKLGIIEIKSIGLGTLRMDVPDLVKQHTVKTVEGKSVVDTDAIWKGLHRPLKPHLKQTNIYARILRENGINVDKIIFIYEYKANQGVKEFVVKPSDAIADPLFLEALRVKRHVDTGAIPQRFPGYQKEKRPCTDCVFRTRCYGSDNANDGPSPADSPELRRVARRTLSHVGSVLSS